MLVASDTSPISNLAAIDRLELLKDQFELVWIPDAVHAELENNPNPTAKTSIQLAYEQSWIRCRTVENVQLVSILGSELDRGEAEAIALSIEMKADLLLLDEREARVFARQAGLVVTGVLGILLRARASGKIPSVKSEIDALRSRAGFFVAPDLERKLLHSAGE